MNLLTLSWKYLSFRPLATGLNVILLAFGLAIITVLLLVQHALIIVSHKSRRKHPPFKRKKQHSTGNLMRSSKALLSASRFAKSKLSFPAFCSTAFNPQLKILS